jgi:LEA14-like dessication related protein
MKYIIYIGAAVLAAYGFKKLYDVKGSTANLDLEIVDYDMNNFKIKARFINVGNSSLKVSSYLGTVYINNTKIGTVKNLNGFTIDEASEKEVNFDIQTSILTGGLATIQLLMGGFMKPVIKIDSVINANGLIINKTTIL